MGRIIDMEQYRRMRAGTEEASADMTKKQYLRQYRATLGRIEAKLEEIERLDNGLYPGAQKISDMPRGGKRASGAERIDQAIDIVRRMRGEMCTQLRKLERQRADIEAAIASVSDPRLRLLLERRYINFQGWQQIADAMGYSVDNIYKMHGSALRMLQIRTPDAQSMLQEVIGAVEVLPPEALPNVLMLCRQLTEGAGKAG